MRNPFAGQRMTKADVVAGIPGAIGGVPDGMAAGLLAGVSPVHGLYASLAGRFFGGIGTSTRLMVITTTSASALAAGSVLTDVAPADRSAAMVVLTLVAGIAMIAAAALRLGRYTRFVSHSVMTGFLLGIAANIVFGQLPVLLGAPSEGSVAALKALHVVLHPRQIHWPSALVGALAVVLLVAVARTRFRTVAALAGLLVPMALVLGLGWDGVATVSDAGAIPRGFPLPQVPEASLLSPSLIAGAVAVTVIVLVQGAGVAEAAPNPDGTRAKTDRDFCAQGSATSSPPFSAACRSVVRWGRPRSTSAPVRAPGGRECGRACGFWSFSSRSAAWSAACRCRRSRPS